MKNLINNIFLVTLLFFIPSFAKGKSTEEKSFIQEIKEKITKEKEKVEECCVNFYNIIKTVAYDSDPETYLVNYITYSNNLFFNYFEGERKIENLGFNITSKYWRENTETLCVISKKSIIKNALIKYNLFYEKSVDIKIRIAKKIEKRIGDVYKIYFNMKSKREVKELFSKLIIYKEIEVEQSIIKIAKIKEI